MKRIHLSGKMVSSFGILLLLCALGLVMYNLWDTDRAGRSAEEAATQLEEYREAEEEDDEILIPTEETEAEDPNRPMPEVTIDGITYIGNLKVPSLGMDLPVITEWSYDLLKIAPCRYTGTVYLDNMVLAAHNYKRHFGPLRYLDAGTEIQFVDMDGITYTYQVVVNEVMEPTEVEKMVESDYDLTLFTCVNSGQARYAIRCNRVDEAT